MARRQIDIVKKNLTQGTGGPGTKRLVADDKKMARCAGHRHIERNKDECHIKKPERRHVLEEIVERRGMRNWHKGPTHETASTTLKLSEGFFRTYKES